ncbi:MAG: MBL fold metallo-hydrolase [Commensalibacter sp.]|nr:MBL fold metallo-hydrolase [Commensalibacter sp.]
MKIIFLGCGGSGGVPLLGGEDGNGNWGGCNPLEKKNIRTRSSVIIENDQGDRVLVDTGPDLRSQFLREKISRVDAVIYTHAHADHIAGLDDLRSVNRVLKKPVPIFATEETLKELKSRFSYAFRPWTTAPHFFRPILDVHQIRYGDRICAANMDIQTFEQSHGFCKTLGLRFESVAYCTDVVGLDDNAIKILQNVHIWIIGCFQRKPHPAHAWLDRVLEWREKIKPVKTILTHMGSDMDWGWLKAHLPDGVEAAYDGLRINSSELKI